MFNAPKLHTSVRRDVAVFLAIATALVACRPPDGATSSTSTSLVFIRGTQEGAEFRLTNGSSRAIRMRVSAESFGVVTPWPSEASMECRDANSTFWYEEPFAIAGGTPEVAEVAPGRQIKVEVRSALPQKHKGGRCHCKLRLEDGTLIESEEFVPE